MSDRRPTAQRDHSWDRKIGLVLPGGGARAAYQVGVLKALANIVPRRSNTIIAGGPIRQSGQRAFTGFARGTCFQPS